jgi:hypothetical protein
MQSGIAESANRHQWDELLSSERFDALANARQLAECWCARFLNSE